jgi:predicted glycoside hydrolase/deacetylase ChbG (UPF0249 family)
VLFFKKFKKNFILNNIVDHTIIANADDLGLKLSVNSAILRCFKLGLINSVSLITNSQIFDQTVALIKSEEDIKNIGVHIDLVEFAPLTSFSAAQFLDESGNWNLTAINRKFLFVSKNTENAFEKEIYGQIERALSAGLKLSHLDSHYHIHALPFFYPLFIKAAKKYKLKLRLAQSYNEGNYLKYLYRKWVNYQIKKTGYYYSDVFENVHHFLRHVNNYKKVNIEIMLHPDLDMHGNLTDHYDPDTMKKWITFLKYSTVPLM